MSSKTPDNSGFVFLHRKLTNWEWYTNVNTAHLFIHCLLSANHKDNMWQGIKIKRGSFITSRAKLSAQTGLSEQAVRTALDHLKQTGEITCEGKNKYTIITVNNYSEYQQPTSNQPAKQPRKNQRNNQQTTNKQPQTIMINNDNKIYSPAPKGAEGIYEKTKKKSALSAAPLGGAPPAADKPPAKSEVMLWFHERGYSAYCAGDFYAETWTLNPNPDYTDWKNKAQKYAERWNDEKARGER